MSEQIPTTDPRAEMVRRGETIQLPMTVTETALQSLAIYAEPYLALARENNVNEVTFQVGGYKISINTI